MTEGQTLLLRTNLELSAGSRKMSAGFSVRKILSAAEFGKVYLPRAASFGWRPGALDHESYFAADNTGFFKGELDGQVVSCMSAVKYSREYAFLGSLVVDAPYRGNGYGLATFKAILTSLPEDCNCGGDSVEEMVAKYAREGFKPYWRSRCVMFDAAKASFSLSEMRHPKGLAIQPACEVPFHDILDYDTSVHVYARGSFLKKWISAPNCFSYAATDHNGSVLGYTVVRSSFRPEDGWMLGPLFAENSDIAKSLYQTVFQRVSAEDRKGVVSIDVPFGKALEIARELPSKEMATCVRVYNKQPSNFALMKVFGLTSLDLG